MDAPVVDAVMAFFAAFDPWQVALVCAGTLLTSTIGALSGFGGMLLMSVVLVPMIGVKALLPVVTVGSLLMNGSRAWVYRRDIQGRVVLRVLLPALPTAALGATLYTVLPSEELLLVLGLFLIASGPLRRWLDRKRIKVTDRSLTVLSAFWGALRGSLPGTGSLIMPVLIAYGLRATVLLGTDAVISLSCGIVISALFSKYALLDANLFALGILIGVFTIPGAYTARWLVTRMDVRLHTAIVEGAIALSGAYFVIRWAVT